MSKFSKFELVLVILLLLFLMFQCLQSAFSNGQTTDETFYSGGAYPIIHYNNYEFLGDHPPLISQIVGLPFIFLKLNFPIENPLYVPGTDRNNVAGNGALFLYKMGNNPHLILFLQRIPIVFLTVLLGFFIFLLGRSIYGKTGALLALCLYAFDPNIIAHGSIFTTDMGITFFYFVSIYFLMRFFDTPSPKRILLAGLACGMAFMSKISGLMLLPVTGILFIIHYGAYRTSAVSDSAMVIPEPSFGFGKWMLGIALFLVLQAVGERQAMVLFGPLLIYAIYFYGRDLTWLRRSRLGHGALRVLVLGGAVLCAVYAWRLKKKYGISTAALMSLGTIVFLPLPLFSQRSAPQICVFVI